ncbi:MAG TPA: hypothetical protein VL832_02260 [Puia sp.]|nr:hypothetical protein [Puia sp.]
MACDPKKPIEPLFLNGPASLKALGVGVDNDKVTIFKKALKEYYDPVDWNPSGSTDPKTTATGDLSKVYPTSYVTPTATPTAQVCNVVRPDRNRLIFLDCGRWLKTHRDFGVVWGRHVYLCSYNDGVGETELPGASFINVVAGMREGLDRSFFSGMVQWDENGGLRIKRAVRIVNWAVADWDEDDQYDWEKIHIIIPDLHLMAGPVAEVWHKIAAPAGYKMSAEIGLMNFVIDLLDIDALKGKLRVIQVGDCYDLWVGHGFQDTSKPADGDVYPLFWKCNSQMHPIYKNLSKDALIGKFNYFTKYFLNSGFENSYVYLINAIKHVQSSTTDWPATYWPQLKTEDFFYKIIYDVMRNDEKPFLNNLPVEKIPPLHRNVILNPAEVALRRLERALGSDFIYIHGNHDNYLIDEDLAVQKAGLKKRVSYFANKKFFVEHAHRMERFFEIVGTVVPRNFDGEWSGFQATNELFLELLQPHPPGFFTARKIAIADYYASIHDQGRYIDELSILKIGRLSNPGQSTGNKTPPNIFAIGHTHIPRLMVKDITFPEGPPRAA